jgi:hypothetical protein
MKPHRCVVLAGAAAALVSCGPNGLVPGAAAPPTAVGTAADVSAEAVDLGTRLGIVRAQNLLSVELSTRFLFDEAALHLESAGQEAAALEADVADEASDAFTRLASSLEAAERALDTSEVAALSDPLAEAGEATLEIESALVGESSGLAAYKASVVANLLLRSAQLYEDGIATSPVDSRTYRDAYGLLREGEYMHEGFASAFEEQARPELRAADTLLAVMFEAMPSSELPEEFLPAEDIAAAAYMLGALLAEEHEAVLPDQAPTGDLLAWMGPMLSEVLAGYESGEAGVAGALAEDVYADLYRPAEEPLGQVAADTAGELGAVLRELKQSIDRGEPVYEIAELVATGRDLAELASDQVE